LDLRRGAAGRPFVCDDLLQALDAIVGESRDSIFTDPVDAQAANSNKESNKVAKIAIADIQVGAKRRELNPAALRVIVESTRSDGTHNIRFLAN
jgi:hypothetical protein